MSSDSVLLLVDVQQDFLPGGALAVPQGDEILPVLERLQPKFNFVVATQDYHPADHGSFAANHPGKNPGEWIDLGGLPQILWPVHCVAGTAGADFATEMSQEAWAAVFQKGKNPAVDSYSGFFDNARRGDTGLGGYLKANGVNRVFVCGLALDYCLKFTALDAQSLGFETYVVVDATRAVNLQAGDGDKAIAEMKQAGVKVLTSDDVADYV